MKSYEDLFKQKWKWSTKNFGKGYSPQGLLDHIEKEVEEIRLNPYDLEEWIDLIFLSADGAHRLVKVQYPQLSPEEIVAVVRSAFEQKLRINKKRKWGKQVEGKAVEHIREENEAKIDVAKALKSVGVVFGNPIL